MPNFSLSDAVFENAAAKYPTPFHLYDEAGIRRNARTLKQAFAWCEDFEEYFAIKALPNPAILRILKEEGCGVDCSSDTELMLADACGFSGRDIMFSANAMPYHSSTMPAVSARSSTSTTLPTLTFSVSTAAFPKPSAAAITPAETSKSATKSWAIRATRNTASPMPNCRRA